MTSHAERAAEVAAGVVTPLLASMDALAEAGRAMHPERAESVVEPLVPYRQPLIEGLAAFRDATWRGDDATRNACVAAAELILDAFDALADSWGDPAEVRRALRLNTRAQETLYPAASTLRTVSRFFLTPDQRENEVLLDRLAIAARPGGGVTHSANERTQRGGFSLYVPEYVTGETAVPLVIAMHGGSGHGRDFLWAWLKAARAAGVAVIAPTSVGGTWSLNGPDLDSLNLRATIETVAMTQAIDRSRVLVTGMSDGGTFSTVCGILGVLPATHVAPVASTFNARLLDLAPEGRLEGLPVYLVHGALDWVFPVSIARGAAVALTEAGAVVVYREIADLGHTYPREENVRILEWFLRRQT